MYECHLTYDGLKGLEQLVLKVYAEKTGWKMSTIDGDPVLGAGKRLFLTSNSMDLRELMGKMIAARTCPLLPAAVREKIEKTVYDTKFGYIDALDFMEAV